MLTLADVRRRARARRSGRKLAKDEAGYAKSDHPVKHSCGICSMFRKPRCCTLVAGIIRPAWGCRFFERK